MKILPVMLLPAVRGTGIIREVYGYQLVCIPSCDEGVEFKFLSDKDVIAAGCPSEGRPAFSGCRFLSS